MILLQEQCWIWGSQVEEELKRFPSPPLPLFFSTSRVLPFLSLFHSIFSTQTPSIHSTCSKQSFKNSVIANLTNYLNIQWLNKAKTTTHVLKPLSLSTASNSVHPLLLNLPSKHRTMLLSLLLTSFLFLLYLNRRSSFALNHFCHNPLLPRN